METIDQWMGANETRPVDTTKLETFFLFLNESKVPIGMGFTWSYLFFNGFRLIFNWVLLGSIGFYWVLPSFS